jgi:hypothetical protein
MLADGRYWTVINTGQSTVDQLTGTSNVDSKLAVTSDTIRSFRKHCAEERVVRNGGFLRRHWVDHVDFVGAIEVSRRDCLLSNELTEWSVHRKFVCHTTRNPQSKTLKACSCLH